MVSIFTMLEYAQEYIKTDGDWLPKDVKKILCRLVYATF